MIEIKLSFFWHHRISFVTFCKFVTIVYRLQNGQTALAIAQKLGYISVVDTLQNVTEVTTIPATEDKYKVVSPETMQETLISDSEDEGGEKTLSFVFIHWLLVSVSII